MLDQSNCVKPPNMGFKRSTTLSSPLDPIAVGLEMRYSVRADLGYSNSKVLAGKNQLVQKNEKRSSLVEKSTHKPAGKRAIQ